MFALHAEGFGLGDLQSLGFSLERHRDIVLPGDLVRVEEELVRPRLGVVKYRHLLVPYHHQLLNLKGVEP